MSKYAGYRIYNGCPDSTLKKQWDKEKTLLARLREKEPDAHCTYHPYEGLFHYHVYGRSISGFFPTRLEALNDALSKL